MTCKANSIILISSEIIAKNIHPIEKSRQTAGSFQ